LVSMIYTIHRILMIIEVHMLHTVHPRTFLLISQISLLIIQPFFLMFALACDTYSNKHPLLPLQFFMIWTYFVLYRFLCVLHVYMHLSK
jgi:hypothetical protein